jgi:5-methylcytosine-specific restriction endonuclease McrA
LKAYTKKYLTYFGYDTSDFVPCECCGAKAVDIHHLTPRSRSKAAINKIDNLMALCRSCHDKAGQNKEFNENLRNIHLKKLFSVKTDHEIKKYN